MAKSKRYQRLREETPDNMSVSKAPQKGGATTASPNGSASNAVRLCLFFSSMLMSTSRNLFDVQRASVWSMMSSQFVGKSKKDTLQRFLLFSIKLFAPLAVLIAIPLLILKEVPKDHFWLYMVITWDALLHTSIWLIVGFTVFLTLFYAYTPHQRSFLLPSKSSSSDREDDDEKTRSRRGRHKIPSSLKKTFLWVMIVAPVACVVHSQIQVIFPALIWSPFVWVHFPIYPPNEIPKHLSGLCLNNEDGQLDNKSPLCLSEDDWKHLSSGTLSSKNPDDVEAVKKGIQYAREQSGGLVVSILSRDTIDSIEPLRYNVEGLLPFFPGEKLAVVIFENDSQDGSREAFKQWATEAVGYTVDLISCGHDNPDCKFGESHRYDATEAKDYFTSSAIGKMAEFRQTVVDHVVEDPRYKDYSHMISLDLDLQVSLSPLGVIHSLGKIPDAAVASSGRQVWPGSFGSLVPPYDFSAFRPLETPKNKHLVDLHGKFCALQPEGDRWRNQCDALSSIQMLFMLSHDWIFTTEPYPTASAFNGAIIYPLKLVKETNAKYDSGTDGQRCEHIGFNLSLKKPTYVNPKWNMHLRPSNPGGPTGYRSFRSVIRIALTPHLGWTLFFIMVGFLSVFVVCIMAITLQLLQTAQSAAQSFTNYQRVMMKLKEIQLEELPTTILDTKENAAGSLKRQTSGISRPQKRTACGNSGILNNI